MKKMINLIFAFIWLVSFMHLLGCESITNIENTDFPGFIDTTNNGSMIPSGFDIEPVYPNPFKDETRIRVMIPKETQVTLVIQNPIGDVVRVLFSQRISPGMYLFSWDGTNDKNKKVNSGKYFVTLESQSDDFLKSQLIKYEK